MRAIALLALVACKHPGAAVATRDHHVPAITVSTSLPGASASTIASSITNPLERQFGQINRLEHMDSRSTFGESTIYLEFSVGTQLDRAEQDVQAAINAEGRTRRRGHARRDRIHDPSDRDLAHRQ
jgi:multidrug efflux pump subunit AcrB